jgi:hypothetical protein
MFRRCLRRAIRRSFATSGRRHPGRRPCRCRTSQSPRRISTCARWRAPRNGVATRSSRAPILARAGAHGAAQTPFAGYLALGSKRLRRLTGRRRWKTSSGVAPPKDECGRTSLYQSSSRAREAQKVLWWRGMSSCASPSSLRVRMNRLCAALHKRFYAKLAIMRSSSRPLQQLSESTSSYCA